MPRPLPPTLASVRHPRPLGFALALWGLLGLVLIGFVAVTAEPALAAAESLTEREAVDEIKTALESTIVSLGGVGTSVVEGRRAAEDAGVAVREIARTSEQLAGAMSLSVFGAQPFLSIAQGFDRQTESLEDLAADLDDLAAALRQNEADVAELRASAVILRDRVGRATPTSPIAASTLRPLVYALLAWLALPALAAIGGGVWLMQRERVVA